MTTTTKPAQTHVYDVVADELAAADVDCVFGYMGEDTAPLLVAIDERGIAYYAARHENQAVAMADGYSRVTGRVGVASVTGGPGFTNALTAVNTARRGGSSVVVIAGAGRPTEDDLEPGLIRQGTPASWLKSFPQAALCDLVGIGVVKPLSGRTAAADTRAAFERATLRREPIVLILGRNLLLERADRVDPAPALSNFDTPVVPDRATITTLADLLQETWAVSRPLILAGRGAALSGAAPALRRLAELTGGILATTLRATGLFNGDPYNVGICGSYSTSVASELITRADCVLAFGAGLNQLTTYDNTLFPQALVVQVDTNERALGLFVDTALSIRADACLTAEALVAELELRGHSAMGFRTEETSTAIASFRKGDEATDESTEDLIDPRTLMLELDRILPDERVLAVDAGQQSRFAIPYLRVSRPTDFVQAVDAGSIGLGMGTGIGAAVGRRDATVIVPVGDGAMMMALGDLETAVRLRLPMVVIVSNDAALGSEVSVLSALGLPTELAGIAAPSFAAIATAMGAEGFTVRSRGDLSAVEERLRHPLEVPLVLDCYVNPAVRAWTPR